MNNLQQIRKNIQRLGSPEKAKASARFFKTKEGEYGYGDIFLGLTVPQQRVIAKEYYDLPLSDVVTLLYSKYHEERLIALFILNHLFKKGDELTQKEIYDLYLANTKYINNWDLIDSSAEYIVGAYLYKQCHSRAKQREAIESQKSEILLFGKASFQDDAQKVLSKLALSDSIWERRIAMLSTFAFIKNGESELTFSIAEILLHDTHDLIHKAVGWLLREVGKKISPETEKEFLDKHYKAMPRTMLRYAIERFDEGERRKYLAK